MVEYRAISSTTAELEWVQSLLQELGVSLPTPPVISCDNIGATFYCANPFLHSRMKHIDIDFPFYLDHVTHGVLQVSHVSTVDQHSFSSYNPRSVSLMETLSCEGIKGKVLH